MNTAVVFRRYPDAEEEPDLIKLEIFAANARYAFRSSEFYCGTREVAEFGALLARFPVSAADRPEFSPRTMNGGDDLLRVVASLEGARTVLHVRMKERGIPKVFSGAAEFSIPAEAAAINRLGALLQTFSQLKHCELRWTPTSAELREESEISTTLSCG